MEGLSRRVFVRRAGLGALAVGLAAGTPIAAYASAKPAARSNVDAASNKLATENSVVAHVVDASQGLVHVFVGTRMIEVTDHGLARSLSAIASA